MPKPPRRPIRSLFFAPANRADLIAKLARCPADCYVIDLEDGTPPGEKQAARAALADSVATLRTSAVRGWVTVRVNEPGSAHHAADVQAAWASGADGVVIPKPGQASDLSAAIDAGQAAGRLKGEASDGVLILGLESLAGVLHAQALCNAHPSVIAAYFGAEDFISEIGGRRSAAGHEVLYARSQVVLAAKMAGIQAIDQAVIEIRDDARFQEDAQRGRDLGYDGKICLLPRQVALANDAYSPSPAEVETCRRLIDAYERAMREGVGTIDFEGRMIDGPLLKRAQHVVAISDRL